MFKTILFGAIAAGILVVGGDVWADTQKGRCSVVASVHGGKKFAVLKCDRASHPGDFIIRSMIWEKDDRVGYNKLARFSGHRFTCDITFDHMSRDGGSEWTNYRLGKCR